MQKLTCLVCGFAVSRSAALKHARTHCAADADADAAPVCAAVPRTRLPGAHLRCRTCTKPFWGKKTRANHEAKCAAYTVRTAANIDSETPTIILIDPRTFAAMPFVGAVHQDAPCTRHRRQFSRQMYR